MDIMTGALWAGYVKTPPCTTCKPGPDGGLIGTGWAIIAIGVGVVLLGTGVMLFGSRSDRGSHEAGAETPPVMDKVQREDLERRAAQAAQAADDEDQQAKTSDAALGGGMIAVGVAGAVLGLIILGGSTSRVNDDKNQLRLAATNLLSGAVDGPAICRQAAGLESADFSRLFPSSSASNPYQSNPQNCAGSPREYADQNTMSNPGVFIPVKYVFSPSFTTNGQVTVHDVRDNRSLCVTVPDTDVAAAAQPSGGSTAPPYFNDVTVDPSPYIADGACPDAPVSSTSS